jgi:hypothetical protein
VPLITLSPEHVRFAEDRSAVSGRIGATIRWIDEDESTSRGVNALLTVVIATGKRTGEAQRGSSTRLGIANPNVRRAHIFYDRVAALNVGTACTIPSLRGDVMAHQLGHLVLRPPGHSPRRGHACRAGDPILGAAHVHGAAAARGSIEASGATLRGSGSDATAPVFETETALS